MSEITALPSDASGDRLPKGIGPLHFGILFSDASCGCWTDTRDRARVVIRRCRDMGLEVVALVVCREKA